MAAGAKPSPRGEAKGCAGVKVDISIQTATIPAKAFLSLPINFFSFHWPYTYDFLHLSEKGKAPHRRRRYTFSFLYNKQQQHISIIYIK